MLTRVRFARSSLLLAALTIAAVGCGDSSAAGGSGSDNDDTNTTGGAGGSSASGNGGDTGNGGDASATGGAGGASEEPFTEVSPGTAGCFSFATGEATPDNPCDGDIYFLTGVNVDMQGVGSGGFCLQPGTYTTLASVPTDYAACAFEPYVEGADGLVNKGYIVVSGDGLHHYRMQVIDNALPAIQFRFDSID